MTVYDPLVVNDPLAVSLNDPLATGLADTGVESVEMIGAKADEFLTKMEDAQPSYWDLLPDVMKVHTELQKISPAGAFTAAAETIGSKGYDLIFGKQDTPEPPTPGLFDDLPEFTVDEEIHLRSLDPNATLSKEEKAGLKVLEMQDAQYANNRLVYEEYQKAQPFGVIYEAGQTIPALREIANTAANATEIGNFKKHIRGERLNEHEASMIATRRLRKDAVSNLMEEGGFMSIYYPTARVLQMAPSYMVGLGVAGGHRSGGAGRGDQGGHGADRSPHGTAGRPDGHEPAARGRVHLQSHGGQLLRRG